MVLGEHLFDDNKYFHDMSTEKITFVRKQKQVFQECTIKIYNTGALENAPVHYPEALSNSQQFIFCSFIFRKTFEQIYSGKVETNLLQRVRKYIRTKLLQVIFKIACKHSKKQNILIGCFMANPITFRTYTSFLTKRLKILLDSEYILILHNKQGVFSAKTRLG